MPKTLTWDDAEDIGILLSELHPDVDPLTVRFTDLHRYVTDLPDFKGDRVARRISGPHPGVTIPLRNATRAQPAKTSLSCFNRSTSS
jgi:FeS assembly protein IscX